MYKTEFVADLPNGSKLYREENGAGGYTYYSDEVGNGVLVWDTCLVHQSTLLATLAAEAKREYEEWRANKDLDKTAD